MDTGLLKGFAAGARVDLIQEVGARLDLVLAAGSVARAEAPGAVAALERAVGKDGREAVVDRVAYTWFNRIIALRFMDANGYTGVGVVSPEPGKTTGQPQVLSDAKGGDFDSDVVSPKTQATVTALLNGTRPSSDPQGEAYGLLLEAYCRFWNQAMPFMFEREGDYTELLMPAALLAADSVRDRAVRTLTDDACGEVEVIGWLYQFYISERKDEVFAGFKKNKKAGAAEIPAATQLFTPHWIVRYLVENSLGRLWLLNHPESQLAEQMDYYIPPVDEETDFLKVSSPEELKIIDPAAGSGHMLTYAFDLLYAIYEEQAYSPSEIPSKILEHNLYGAEIDPRAGALAAFALTMKAAKKRKLFLKNPVQPHICVLENVRFEQADLDFLWSLTSGSVVRSDVDVFWNAFEHADTFGSLIQPNEALIPVLKPVVEQLESTGNLLASPARRVLNQAEQLCTRYHVVVANPPYMGMANMDARLAEWAAREHPRSKADLGVMFIERCVRLKVAAGSIAMITMQSWMFLASFAGFRERTIAANPPVSLLHLGTGAFDTIGGAVVATAAFILRAGPPTRPSAFFRITGPQSEGGKSASFVDALAHGGNPIRHDVAVSAFEVISGRPMAYWLPSFDAFRRPRLSSHWRSGGRLKTHNTQRYVRYWWEVSRTSPRWRPLVKGGEFRRYFGNRDFVVDWSPLALEHYESHGGLYAESSRGRAGITWTMITGQPSFRLKAPGDEFDSASPTILPTSEHVSTEATLAYLNSDAALEILAAINPTINNRVTDILELPLPLAFEERRDEIERASAAAIEATRALDGQSEPSADASPSLVALSTRLAEYVQTEIAHHDRNRRALATAEQRLNEIFPSSADFKAPHGWTGADLDGAGVVTNLISFSVGCMLGRYAVGHSGLVLANQGDSIQDFLARIPSTSFIPDLDGVIPVVDGEWFEDDIVAKFRQFLRVAFGEEHFEENLKFVIDSLGVKDLRDYFVKSFYKDHVQRYKKRPIYWMFSSPKGSFNALVYLHRYNPSTVSTVLNEYLREFIKKLEASFEQQEHIIVSGAGAREVAAAQREAERLRKVLIELADYERDLYDLASKQIDLDLDDGVLVNYQKFGAALKDIGLKKGNESA